MIILENVLSAEEVALARSSLEDVEFVDGRVTASGAAASAKHNLQAARDTDDPAPLDRAIVGALSRHELFRRWAIPQRFSAPLYSCYKPGMEYGPHVDAPLMGLEHPVRTDVSITLFLSGPDEYDGGELQIEAETGALQVKLPAGHAVAYSTQAVHQVRAVTRGQRLAAVTWAQSFVREEGLRRILADMDRVLSSLRERMPDSAESRMLDAAYNNLLRRSIHT
jgi:PKHD-type hydroxylase